MTCVWVDFKLFFFLWTVFFFFFNLKRNVLIFEEREPHGKEAKVSIMILFFVIFIFDLLVLILIFRFLFCLFSSNDFVLISQYLSIWSETVLIVPSSETSCREGNDGSIIQRSTLILVSLNFPAKFLIILMFFLLSFSFHRP